jgi:hypothetical protein
VAQHGGTGGRQALSAESDDIDKNVDKAYRCVSSIAPPQSPTDSLSSLCLRIWYAARDSSKHMQQCMVSPRASNRSMDCQAYGSKTSAV